LQRACRTDRCRSATTRLGNTSARTSSPGQHVEAREQLGD
jgi:hypothetical protein